VAERPIAGALKAPEGKLSGGSNPSLAAHGDGGDDVTLGLIVIDIAVIVGLSVLIGAVAPRVPTRWLLADVGPLAFLPWESSRRYRRLGVTTLARRLPELGGAFGGSSKAQLPGVTPEHLSDYLVEVRRAEWVHWASIAVSLVLFAFNPWWLALTFVVVVAGGNLPFILVLRNNRLRIRGILERNGRSL
jgi:hypothetical protein